MQAQQQLPLRQIHQFTFLTRDRVYRSIECPSSERTLRSAAFSGSRRSNMAEKEVEIQSDRATRAQLRADKLEKDANSAKKAASAARKELNSVKTILNARFSQLASNQHLEQQVHNLKQEVNSLKRSAHVLKAEQDSG